MNSDWSVIWPTDGEDKTIALVKLFAMVTLSLKVTRYALRWLPGKINLIVPFTTSPPTNRRIAQIFPSKTLFSSPSRWQTPQAAKERKAVRSVDEKSGVDPTARGRMAPECTEPAAVCLHVPGSSHKSIKISLMLGTLKLVSSLFQRREITVNKWQIVRRVWKKTLPLFYKVYFSSSKRKNINMTKSESDYFCFRGLKRDLNSKVLMWECSEPSPDLLIIIFTNRYSIERYLK